MDIELWFSDLSNDLGGPTQWKQNHKKYPTEAKFQHIQTLSYQLKEPLKGICEFVPCNFVGQFFSILNIQV